MWGFAFAEETSLLEIQCKCSNIVLNINRNNYIPMDNRDNNDNIFWNLGNVIWQWLTHTRCLNKIRHSTFGDTQIIKTYRKMDKTFKF